MMKSSNINTNDVDYIPAMGEDIESDHEQLATRSKKQHRSHYIAPLSMNKFANLAKKHRVLASKVSRKPPLDSNATKENQSKATITMAELILSNKVSQRQMTKPNYIKRVAKRRLVLVDEDDDEYDETFQDVNKVDMELHCLKDNDNQGDFVKSQGTIARNHSYAPLIHSSWHKVPHKDKIWEYVLKRCSRAEEMSMSQKNMLTAGPKYFARIRDEMINDDPNKELPALTKMFEQTRKRTEGRAYVDTYDDTKRKIISFVRGQMKNYKS
ncbi:hypothetical protein R6Q59_006514 [Mikania micrantha]